jgi:hypothetical protein
MKFFRCEPGDRPLSGDHVEAWSGAGEYWALVTEACYKKSERKMDDKQMGVLRHILTAVGAVMVYMGYTDDATWVMVSGSMATMIGFAWSWMAKA